MSDLWLPHSARTIKAEYLCRVCGAQLQQQEYRPHVTRCFQRSADELREQSPQNTMGELIGDDAGDGERIRWVRKNRKAILEGRVKM